MALTGVYIEKAISDITALRRLADDLSEQDENRQGAVLRQIAQAAREIKGQGGTFDFSLLSRIARSLYEFTSTLTHVDIRRSGIVMAHVDAMELIIMDRITGDGGRLGTELSQSIEAAARKLMDTEKTATPRLLYAYVSIADGNKFI